MCELYVKADPILYESRSRSLRIRGVVTTPAPGEPVLGHPPGNRRRRDPEHQPVDHQALRGSDGLSRRGAQLRLHFLRVSCTRYLAQRREKVAELSLVGRRAPGGEGRRDRGETLEAVRTSSRSGVAS